MSYPNVSRIELPILQELVAMGGNEDVRFLYDRLAGYFPQLEREEIIENDDGHNETWRRLVQRAGRKLDDKKEITRDRGFWIITQAGRKRVEEEGTSFSLSSIELKQETLSHTDIQQMLLEIGKILGYHVEMEYEFYDVVWRENERSPRLSHVFEVQHKGNIDSALAKLKKAYDAQRSKPFLILASERDTNRALRSTDVAHAGAFREISSAIKILSFEQLRLLHRSLKAIADLLPDFFER
jgi:hypothetical protein